MRILYFRVAAQTVTSALLIAGQDTGTGSRSSIYEPLTAKEKTA